MRVNESRSAESGELTPKQEKAVSALLSAATIQGAAIAAGVGESTLLRWLKLPAFVEAYRTARRETVAQSVAQLQGATGRAVTVLLSVAEDGTATAGARVSAARAILDTAIRAVELDDLGARVDALEAILAEQQK